jgi:REP element-mobilizing transposase RayT
MDAPPFFNPYAETHFTAANLPHWRQDGVLYFVTFRLADSLPSEKIHSLQLEREAWLRAHPGPLTPAKEKEFWQLFGSRTQQFLDAGHGSCLLARPGIRSIVEDSLCHFDGQRYELGRFAVAANQVHVLVRPLHGLELSKLVQAWKSYTARRINAALERKGPVWQKETYDHIVRSASAQWHIERYIEAHKK